MYRRVRFNYARTNLVFTYGRSAGLKVMGAQQLAMVVAVLGFTSFGYATREFEVTLERLGCYRAEEHIDNPKFAFSLQGSGLH